MAVHKVIELSSTGSKSEYAGKSTSAGAGDAGEFVVLGAGGKLDPTVLPNGIGADAITATATVFFDESNSALTGLTPGSKYFLSATAGAATLTAPTTAGQFVQCLGIATSATSLHVNLQEPILRA